jgi:soluble cytochrome b562
MGFVLTKLREAYPEVRIYSFDTNLQLSALNTLRDVNKISETKLPAVIVNDQTITGFRTYDDLKKLIPDLKEIDKKRADEEKANKAKATSTGTTSKSILDKII